MECPSCFEIFDELKKIPRNLPCGQQQIKITKYFDSHTYCEECLTQWFQQKQSVECPTCRFKLDIHIPPQQLSKNFIAIELAQAQKNKQKKHALCPKHNEPIKFFCENEKANLCSECIVDHSGHNFVKIEFSGIRKLINTLIEPVLKEKMNKLLSKAKKKLEIAETRKKSAEKYAKDFSSTKEKTEKTLNLEFDMLIAKLLEKKEIVHSQLSGIFEEEEKSMKTFFEKHENFCKGINTSIEEISQLQAEFEKEDSQNKGKNAKKQDQIKSLEDKLESTSNEAIAPKWSKTNPPKLIFDYLFSTKIPRYCRTLVGGKNQMICYFGEKNKMLSQSIENNEWILEEIQIVPAVAEINQYASAVGLPNGDIFIIGGGFSKSVSKFNCRKLKLTPRRPMLVSRKEHVALLLGYFIYALGGFDSTSNKFLGSCEKYNIEKDEWTFIAQMKIAKCAFAATSFQGKQIFTFGGQNGKERVVVIEKYEIEKNIWNVVTAQLKTAISNGASININDEKILLLGGGHGNGFCFETTWQNPETNEFKEGSLMTNGRDLRNKVIQCDDYIFAIGGTSLTGEKFSISRNEWTPIKSYADWIEDNLDSWCCSMTYNIPGYDKKFSNLMEYNKEFELDKDYIEEIL